MILSVAEMRALRALGVSGRRMLRCAAGWSVHARGDRRTRPVAVLDAGSCARLVAAGRLVEAVGGGLVLGDGVEKVEGGPRFRGDERVGKGDERVRDEAVARDPRLHGDERVRVGDERVMSGGERIGCAPGRAFLAAGRARTQAGGVGFVRLARMAEAGGGPVSRRGALAGLHLVKDAEASGRQSGLSMNWSGVARDRDALRSWRGGGVDAGARAREALARVAGCVEEEAFALCWAACVEGRSLRWLAGRFGFRVREAGRRLGVALERLADGYEGVV